MNTSASSDQFYHVLPPFGPDLLGVAVFLQSVLVIATFLANSLIVLVIVRTRALRTFTNTLFASLTIANFVAGFATFLLLIVAVLPKDVSKHQALCSFKLVPFVISWTALWYSILAVTVDRYFWIVRPFDYPYKITRKRILVCIISIWTYSIICGIISFAISLDFAENLEICDLFKVIPPPVLYFIESNVIVVGIPYIYCYVRIFLVARAHSARIAASRTSIESSTLDTTSTHTRIFMKSDKKYVWSILTVIFLFFGCWAPVLILNALEMNLKNTDLSSYRLVGSFLGQCSSALNPVAFAWWNKDFRCALKKMCRFRCDR